MVDWLEFNYLPLSLSLRTSFYVLLIFYLFIRFFFQLLDCYLEAYHHVFDPKEKKRLAQVCRSRND